MQAPNKILIITYYWPPAGGPGVQRWLKFIKYLPKYETEPYVLTVDEKNAAYPQTDESLLNDISKDLKIYRTKTVEIFSFYKRLSKKKQIPFSGFANEKKPSLSQKISRFIRGNFFIPDPRKAWNKYAYKKAVELIKENNIKTVITTSPPHSTQLIGLKLKKNLGIKWIADLRDPWTDIFYYDKFYPTFISKKIDLSFEKRVFNNADKIIVVSNTMRDTYIYKYNLNEENIKAVTNGFDENDFLNVKSYPKEKFTITYTGTISDIYPMDTFISSLEKLKESDIIVNIVGNIHNDFVNIINQKQLAHLFKFVGHTSHEEAIKHMVSSDLLLLLIPKTKDSRGILTGKLFEYLASEKPILALGPTDGDVAHILKETSAGIIHDFGDVKNVTKSIKKYFLGKRHNIQTKNNNILNYSRKELTRELVEFIF